MIRIFHSNRMEKLIEALAGCLQQTGLAIWEPEWIATQSLGMRTWLGMELAQRFGIWANARFPFPRDLCRQLFEAVLGDEAETADSFHVESLPWSILALLPDHIDQPEFESLRNYLAIDDSDHKRYQLARRIAEVFDQYTLFRPDLLVEWEAGRQEHWQAILWQALVDRFGSVHVAARAQQFFQTLRKSQEAGSALPQRLSLFGVSSLPPLILQVLAAVAERVEVNLFLLSPSQEYWGDIRSRREIIRATGHLTGDPDLAEERLHLDQGHPLLASMGRLGRDYQQLIEGSVDYLQPDENLFEDPSPAADAGMLTALQADILHLRSEGPPRQLHPQDESIALHACHSPLREVEVLADQLRRLFDQDPTLQPHDVIVMTPDIEKYAPLVDSVFGSAPTEQRIPFGIADRSQRLQVPELDAFLALLAGRHSRATAVELLDLLQREPIRQRFSLDDDDVEQIRGWVDELQIRWGADADHRAELGQPGLPENTWRFGLDRMLLGLALPGEGESLFGGVLPFDEVEGRLALTVGRLASFCTTLFDRWSRLRKKRSIAEWQDELTAMGAELLADDDGELQSVGEALAQLSRRAKNAGFDAQVDLEMVQAYLEEQFSRRWSSRGFLTGGVTFCNLLPMRSIPFRVICLLGMNDGAFPRSTGRLAFNLMAEHPRIGDRSVRADDRYLFLETLLSARERLLIFYVGRSQRDNSPLGPSVLVNELIDVINESFELPPSPSAAPKEKSDLWPRLQTVHHLQAFHPEYFSPSSPGALFSYAESCFEGAQALRDPKQAPAAYLDRPLPASEPTAVNVDLEELIRFFTRPVDTLLQKRLGVSFRGEEAALAEREPLEIDALSRYLLGQDLLERALAGQDLDLAGSFARGRGVLPLGSMGRVAYREMVAEISPLAKQVEQLTQAGKPRSLSVEFSAHGMRLSGQLSNIWPDVQLFYSFGRLKAKRLLAAWIRHLAMLCLPERDRPASTMLLGMKKRKIEMQGFGPPETDAGEILGRLLDLYALGLREPLRFFPETAYVYASRRKQAQGNEAEAHREALGHARKEFVRFGAEQGEGESESIQRVFGPTDPLVESTSDPELRFSRLALAVFAPMLASFEGGRL